MLFGFIIPVFYSLVQGIVVVVLKLIGVKPKSQKLILRRDILAVSIAFILSVVFTLVYASKISNGDHQQYLWNLAYLAIPFAMMSLICVKVPIHYVSNFNPLAFRRLDIRYRRVQ